jgi:hypothetical protein
LRSEVAGLAKADARIMKTIETANVEAKAKSSGWREVGSATSTNSAINGSDMELAGPSHPSG